MQLYLVYFGANLFGVGTDPWLAVTLALTLYASAFLGEIWRGCIQAVPRGQWEGARALALGYLLQLRLVILPQALRIAVPPTVGFLVQLLKGTSLASIIGFTELTRAAQMVNNSTFRPFTVYALVTLIYFALCWPLSYLSRRLENRLKTQHLPTVKAQA
jgi:polar amino acid transport system permease protein